MPCGGIYPLKGSWAEKYGLGKCWQCRKPIGNAMDASFCDEWDCLLHTKCVSAFLLTEEGKIVLEHGHEVIA